MKKLFVLSLVLILVSVAASAQQNRGERLRSQRMEQSFNNGRINRPDRFELRKGQFRYKMAQRRARRDGFVNPRERRRLMMMKRHEFRQRFSFRHNNNRRRVI